MRCITKADRKFNIKTESPSADMKFDELPFPPKDPHHTLNCLYIPFVPPNDNKVYEDIIKLEINKISENLSNSKPKVQGRSAQRLKVENYLVINTSSSWMDQLNNINEHKAIWASRVPKVSKSIIEVQKRLRKGCGCHRNACFKNLNPNEVHRHRLNISNLSKEEHDMYLMGMLRASLSNKEKNNMQQKRQRMRQMYIHDGRKICLWGFVYLENCSYAQLIKIRKQVMNCGINPRLGGDNRKKSNQEHELNRALRNFIICYMSINFGVVDPECAMFTAYLPCHISEKNMYKAYKDYMKGLNKKVVSEKKYRIYLRKQFPMLRFFSQTEEKLRRSERVMQERI